ncbi:MAG: hypothetical protein ACWA5A_10725 [Marinibacterium sp.]
MSARSDTSDPLFLHIGHGKTGSSYLQSALALSQQALADHGFDYPLTRGVARRARRGHITGGNFGGPQGIHSRLADQGPFAPGRARLMSSEHLFNYALRRPETFLEDLAALRGDGDLHVLCLIRDPLDHAVSTYQQSVKRGGFAGPLDEALTRYRLPASVLAVLETLKGAGARLTVRNYSRHRDRLLAVAEDWLALPPGTLAVPPVAQVNRSLTRAELEFQRRINATGTRIASQFVSDPWCNHLPDIRAEDPPLAPAALAAFLDRMRAAIDDPRFAALVPEAERPRVGQPAEYAARFPDPATEMSFTFTADQLDVLAREIGGILKAAEDLAGGDTPPDTSAAQEVTARISRTAQKARNPEKAGKTRPRLTAPSPWRDPR